MNTENCTPCPRLLVELRQEAYVARRAIRSGDAHAWLVRYERTTKRPAERIQRLAELLAPLLLLHCVAKAEVIAIDELARELRK